MGKTKSKMKSKRLTMTRGERARLKTAGLLVDEATPEGLDYDEAFEDFEDAVIAFKGALSGLKRHLKAMESEGRRR